MDFGCEHFVDAQANVELLVLVLPARNRQTASLETRSEFHYEQIIIFLHKHKDYYDGIGQTKYTQQQSEAEMYDKGINEGERVTAKNSHWLLVVR